MNLEEFLKRQPWHIAYVNIGQRCTNKSHPKYKFYGGKGIKRSITSSELKSMYFRDKAHSMKNPSVDRLDVSKDYCVENCRFIEMEENRKLANDARTARLSKPIVEVQSIEQLRDLMSKVNRIQPSQVMNSKDVENIFSPPFKGTQSRTKVYQYPPQLLGIDTKKTKQRVRVSGSTSGGSQFGGISGSSYGVATGGSYLT